MPPKFVNGRLPSQTSIAGLCPQMNFPSSKLFAFSILDDTDDSTLENVKPAYDFLTATGFRTTKTVWPLDCPEGSRIFFAAETLQHKPYRDFVHNLARDGFEIAFHGATMESSRRERTLRALEYFKAEFGRYPRVFCNHGHNRENLYWGPKRFQSRMLRRFLRFTKSEAAEYFSGEMEQSEYFWGDLCQQRITYVRNFTFDKVNVLDVDRVMPYRLNETKFVNYWFSTADAPDVNAFNRLLTRERIDRLEQSGGVCIISTHLGKGFVKNGRLNTETTGTLRYLSSKRGWFVPVVDVLDYLRQCRGHDRALERREITRLERRFMIDKIARWARENWVPRQPTVNKHLHAPHNIVER